MRLRKPALWLLALSIVVGGAGGSAASLGGLGSAPLGGGAASVAPCDGDGVTVSYTTQGGSVTATTVAGIADPGCEGATLSITLRGAGGERVAAAGPQLVPTDPGSDDQAVTLGVTPSDQPAESIAGFSVELAGP